MFLYFHHFILILLIFYTDFFIFCVTALTFGSGVRDRLNFAIMWHEGLNARKARDVASSYVKFLVKNSSAAILFCGVTTAVVKTRTGRFTIQRWSQL